MSFRVFLVVTLRFGGPFTRWLRRRIALLVIPEGMYCYDGYGICPFWRSNPTKPSQENGYCLYLRMGDWDDDNLSLLWDSCKACGEKDDIDESEYPLP